MEYDKNQVYQTTIEGVGQGLFIGIDNKYYDDLYKYWCFLRMVDEAEEDKRNREVNKLFENEKLLKRLESEKSIPRML